MLSDADLHLAKMLGDTTSIVLALSAIADWLPPVAALLSIIWMLIRIYETDTVQGIIYRMRNKL